ncbi:response regulator transcription factor [Clostridium sardiniense]|uniref:Stage 0 sporulation protein A homolog n=1 Tax=Clostridium sardiniense TaxID=29369 RepID=A0ABS7KZK0_CLOSR|nr:response regulator transcription factor [Clostridium sardiniense]MBM7833558.1 DNA-binding response OmpR family regulator [Clostridium sardiniense]MBY0756238.1 response regulator transcription factor [Clostridium sardiniense]MDQ0458818.1 DNA-binding response OmpR family regulator [Clostridium sardiniense]
MRYSILLCDDEKEILDVLEVYLSKEGYKILKATNGVEALEIYKNNDVNIAVIDIMMPKINGIRVVKELRENSNIPIIMLSAKSRDEDKILGLNIGADDYITKPFNPLEVVARVKAQLRRVYKLIDGESDGKEIIKIGEVELDRYNVKVRFRDKELELTSIEYKIIKYLMENAGRILTKNQIFEEVWNEVFLGGDNTIMVHISRLREKIEDNSKKPKYLKTIRGLGYKFEKNVDI